VRVDKAPTIAFIAHGQVICARIKVNTCGIHIAQIGMCRAFVDIGETPLAREARHAFALIRVDQIDALAMRATRLRITFVHVHITVFAPEARTTFAHIRLVVLRIVLVGPDGLVEVLPAVGSRVRMALVVARGTVVDLRLTVDALVALEALALVRIETIGAVAVEHARLIETIVNLELTIGTRVARVITQTRVAIGGHWVVYTLTVVHARSECVTFVAHVLAIATIEARLAFACIVVDKVCALAVHATRYPFAFVNVDLTVRARIANEAFALVRAYKIDACGIVGTRQRQTFVHVDLTVAARVARIAIALDVVLGVVDAAQCTVLAYLALFTVCVCLTSKGRGVRAQWVNWY
jgi:hypothetical protein